MNDKITFIKNNLKSLRVKQGLTQEKTAEILGVSRATYVEYETRPENVKIETYNKLCDIFNCELVDFFLINSVTNSDEAKEEKE